MTASTLASANGIASASLTWNSTPEWRRAASAIMVGAKSIPTTWAPGCPGSERPGATGNIQQAHAWCGPNGVK